MAVTHASPTSAHDRTWRLPASRAASTAPSTVSSASASCPRTSSACARPTIIGTTNWPWPTARETASPRRRCTIASSKRSHRYSAKPR